jgi:hypothetical protein
VKIAPRYVYIVRQYSGCDESADCSAPWESCSIFEDHIYAKSEDQCSMAEVMVVIGYTPKVMGPDQYGVFHLMMALEQLPE